MSFKYETQFNSPNYTDNSRVAATWGRGRIITAIAIHWWGDPNQNPTYEGIVNYLCRPGGNSSAHLVATGTGRRVAQLVDFDDAAWATNSANPYTISIECDPRCRPEDYDVVAELIANIRSAYGDLPLVPHKQFVATACPGNYNLAELDRRARLKDGSGDWGVVKDINQPAPVPAPPTVDSLYRVFHGSTQKGAYSSDKNAWSGFVFYGEQGRIEYQKRDVTTELRNKFRPAPAPTPAPQPTPEPVPTPVPSDGFTSADRTVLQDIAALLKQLVEMFSKVFK